MNQDIKSNGFVEMTDNEMMNTDGGWIGAALIIGGVAVCSFAIGVVVAVGVHHLLKRLGA